MNDSLYVGGGSLEGSVGPMYGKLMSRVYLWMSMALMISALTSYYISTRTGFLYVLGDSTYLFYILAFVEMALVLVMSFFLREMSLVLATCLFIVYAVLNGLTLSVLFLSYSRYALCKGFVMTAGLFSVMALVGHCTKRDLSSYGGLLLTCLFGLLVATIVNIFHGSALLDYVLCYVGIILFMVLTAWDVSMIRVMFLTEGESEDALDKVALLGALSLYLDFVNLFIHFMRLFFRKN